MDVSRETNVADASRSFHVKPTSSATRRLSLGVLDVSRETTRCVVWWPRCFCSTAALFLFHGRVVWRPRCFCSTAPLFLFHGCAVPVPRPRCFCSTAPLFLFHGRVVWWPRRSTAALFLFHGRIDSLIHNDDAGANDLDRMFHVKR
ncbi:MAG: hypothetical protein AAF772_17170 [Acidobacteriota bacterium]